VYEYAFGQTPAIRLLERKARLRLLTDVQGQGPCWWAASWLRRVRGRTSTVLVGLELLRHANGMRRLDMIRDQRTAK